MKPRRDRGLTAIELTVVIIVVGISAAVTVPALLRGARNAVVVRCEARLKALWKLDSDRRTQGQPMPDAKGSAYWSALVGPGGDADSLACPLAPGRMPYGGPRSEPAHLPRNHP